MENDQDLKKEGICALYNLLYCLGRGEGSCLFLKVLHGTPKGSSVASVCLLEAHWVLCGSKKKSQAWEQGEWEEGEMSWWGVVTH